MIQNPSEILPEIAGIPQSGIISQGDDFHSRDAP